MWYKYLLINENRTYKYIGIAKELKRRLMYHNKGYTQSTRPFIPFNSIIELGHTNEAKDARKLEKFYKSGQGRDKVKAIFNNLIQSESSSIG